MNKRFPVRSLQHEHYGAAKKRERRNCRIDDIGNLGSQIDAVLAVRRTANADFSTAIDNEINHKQTEALQADSIKHHYERQTDVFRKYRWLIL